MIVGVYKGVQGCTRVYKGDCRGVKSGNRVPYPRVALMYHHPMGRGGVLVVGREATTPLKIWETVDIENHAREKSHMTTCDSWLFNLWVKSGLMMV